VNALDRDIRTLDARVASSRSGTATHAVRRGESRAVCGTEVAGRISVRDRRGPRTLSIRQAVTCGSCRRLIVEHRALTR
jgi:hypothetical protein